MVIVSRYRLEETSANTRKVVSYEQPLCTCCGSPTVCIGRRKRIMLLEDGTQLYLSIRRLRCLNVQCRSIHHELPNKIIPYKRYEYAVFKSVLSGVTSNLPCEDSTLRAICRFVLSIEIEQIPHLVNGNLPPYTRSPCLSC